MTTWIGARKIPDLLALADDFGYRFRKAVAANDQRSLEVLQIDIDEALDALLKRSQSSQSRERYHQSWKSRFRRGFERYEQEHHQEDLNDDLWARMADAIKRHADDKPEAQTSPLGKEIVFRRRNLKLTQTDLAALAGLSAPSVLAAEKGNASERVNAIVLETLAKLERSQSLAVEPTPDDGELKKSIPLCPHCLNAYEYKLIDINDYFSHRLICPHCRAAVGEWR